MNIFKYKLDLDKFLVYQKYYSLEREELKILI